MAIWIMDRTVIRKTQVDANIDNIIIVVVVSSIGFSKSYSVDLIV